ncbi:hypothetical protein ACN24L_23475 [Streptomyces microflavus]
MHRVGIESDQLVYDYLSRVGDLAQQQQLSSGARMRLVSTLRSEIDRQRATEGADSPAAVRRIIGRLGTPGELVGAAAESGDGTVPLPSVRSGPTPRTGDQRRPLPRPRNGLLRKSPKAPEEAEGPEKPGPRPPVPPPVPPRKPVPGGARRGPPSPPPAAPCRTRQDHAPRRHPRPQLAPPLRPHVLGPDQQSTGDGEWWRLEPGPFDAGTAIPGFFGGIEAPELLGRRPRPDAPEADDEAEDAEEVEESGTEEDGATEEAPAAAPSASRGRAAASPSSWPNPWWPPPRPPRRLRPPLLLLAALLLLAGAVTGSWIPLAGGWLIAYGSRTLSRTEAKWAALGLPGVVVAGALVWVWGRMDGRWGEPIAQGALRDVLAGAWPVVVRVAAVASALYLVWRARRRTG